MIKRSPLVLGKKSLKQVTDDIAGLVETKPGLKYFGALISANHSFYILHSGFSGNCNDWYGAYGC